VSGRTYIYGLCEKRSDARKMCPCGQITDYKCRTYRPFESGNFNWKSCIRLQREIAAKESEWEQEKQRRKAERLKGHAGKEGDRR
jgi:hypothetical protein